MKDKDLTGLVMEYSELGNHYRVKILRHWVRAERLKVDESGADIMGELECFELKTIEILAESKIVICGEVGEIFEVSRMINSDCANGWQLF